MTDHAMPKVLEAVERWLHDPIGMRAEIPVWDHGLDLAFNVTVSIEPVGRLSEMQAEHERRNLEWILNR